MKCAVRKLRPPIKTHGGKAYLARRIVELMPDHRVYVEPFFGGGSVLLNKPPCEREVAGDINPDLMNMWSDIARFPDAIYSLALRLPYDEETFLDALAFDPKDHENGAFERTFAFLVRSRFSRGGLGKTFAWSPRERGGKPGDENAWDTIRAELPAISDRVRDVAFHCRDALELVRGNDGPGTLHYLDPPYLHETRTARAAYQHEMTTDQHKDLLATIVQCSGTVMISGYRSMMYDLALNEWRRVDFDMPNHSGQGQTKQRRTECLWINR